MGGRGMGSATSRGGAAAKPTGPASVADSVQRLKDIGLSVGEHTKDNLEHMGEQFTQDVADVLTELEGKYGAIGDTGNMRFVAGGLGRGTYAAVSYSPWEGFRSKELQITTRLDYDTHNSKSKQDRDTGWTAAFDTSRYSGVQATMIHEYGHILHNSLIVHHGVQTKRQRTAFLNNQRKTIQKIATEKYGATSSDVSRYGTSSPAEFFAEAFASANGGSPNAIGKAFNDYMGTIKDWKIPGQKVYNK